MSNFLLDQRNIKPKSVKAPQQTRQTEPKPKHTSSSSSSQAPQERRSRKKKSDRTAFQKELESANAFAKCIIDPSKTSTRFPLNKCDSGLCRQRISVIGNNYCDDGSCNLYVTNDPEYPLAVSVRAPKVYLANTHPALTITQPVEVLGGAETKIYAPIIMDKTVLFNAPVTFADGSSSPGYHFTINTAALSFTVFHGPGMSGSFTWWHRTANVKVPTVVQLIPTATSFLFNYPVNATALGFEFVLSDTTVDRFVITTTKNTGTEVVIGNHPSYAQKYAIPSLNSLGLRHGRTIGLRTWVEFQGSDIQNGGRIASAQFPPGVYPGMYDGANAYEQILNSRVRQSYHGHVKNGACFVFVPPSEQSFYLLSAPKRYGEDGFAMATWYSVTGNPQPYAIFVDIVLEFTTSSTAFDLQPPSYSELEMVSEAMRVLESMCCHTENPMHEMLSVLWDKLKHKARKIVTDPHSWYTIAEVVGTAALAL